MKKIKTVAIFLSITCLTIITAGCQGYHQTVCYDGVRAKFPNSEIIMIPGERYRFIVRKSSGDILYVKTMNLTNGEPTLIYTVFKGEN